MSTILSKDMNFADRLKTVRVEIPEWDCVVILRQLTTGQSQELKHLADPEDIPQQLAMSIVDENNKRVFVTAEEIQKLADMPSNISDRLIAAARVLNNLTPEAIDTFIKNLQASRNGDSGSA